MELSGITTTSIDIGSGQNRNKIIKITLQVTDKDITVSVPLSGELMHAIQDYAVREATESVKNYQVFNS